MIVNDLFFFREINEGLSHGGKVALVLVTKNVQTGDLGEPRSEHGWLQRELRRPLRELGGPRKQLRGPQGELEGAQRDLGVPQR